MSFSKLIPRAVGLYSYEMTWKGADKPRQYHRSPDYQYQKIWKPRGVDFRTSLGEQSNFSHSPQLVNRVMRTMTVSKMRGDIPFVHAAPASLRVLTKGIEVLEGVPKNGPFHYLRLPYDRVSQRSLEEAQQEAMNPYHVRKSGLLSMSYALGSSNRRLEGAAAWGFVNHYGNEQYFAIAHLWEKFLKDLGIRCDPKAEAYFQAKGTALIRKYNRLRVGDFYVLSVPKSRVDRYVYDSAPYNIPTKKAASEVASSPQSHLDTLDANQTHMATMLLCHETLSPESGIAIIRANDTEEVEQFCAHAYLVPLNQIEEFSDYVSSETCLFEEQEKQARSEADAELEQLAFELKQYLNTGHLATSEVAEEVFCPGDYPADLP